MIQWPVTTEDNKIVFLPVGFIKKSVLLKDLVKSMDKKNQLQNAKKNKLLIPESILLKLKVLLENHTDQNKKDDYESYLENSYKIKDTLKKMRLSELAHIVEALNYLDFSDSVSEEALNILHEKTNKMKLNFKKEFEIERMPRKDKWRTINKSNDDYRGDDYDDYEDIY